MTLSKFFEKTFSKFFEKSNHRTRWLLIVRTTCSSVISKPNLAVFLNELFLSDKRLSIMPLSCMVLDYFIYSISGQRHGVLHSPIIRVLTYHLPPCRSPAFLIRSSATAVRRFNSYLLWIAFLTLL